MINMQEGRVQRGGLDERIEAWIVLFRTPFGLCDSLHEAVEVCTKNNFDPELAIIPVAAARSNATYEVFISGN